MKPIVKSGRFTAGADLQCGDNVVVDVAEEVRVGDRCVLPDNAYLSGRCITLGDDFFGYAHWNRRLEIGRGRIDEEEAILTVGDRCTFHDNRIDLARQVSIGHDVGLSPEVTIYTHGYWQSVLAGFPCTFESVLIGPQTIVGYRSVVLAGAHVNGRAVIGAQSVVRGYLPWPGVYAGNPAKQVAEVQEPSTRSQEAIFAALMIEYGRTLVYRGIPMSCTFGFPLAVISNCRIDVAKLTVQGEEDACSDDLRWFLFTRGIRLYTKRPFRKLGRMSK